MAPKVARKVNDEILQEQKSCPSLAIHLYELPRITLRMEIGNLMQLQMKDRTFFGSLVVTESDWSH